MPAKIIAAHENNGGGAPASMPLWRSKYYCFDLRVYVPGQRAILENIVTDPYSVDLALNGVKSRITDLNDPETQPDGWEESRSPSLGSVNDLSIYELHIPRFQCNDMTVRPSIAELTWPSADRHTTA